MLLLDAFLSGKMGKMRPRQGLRPGRTPLEKLTALPHAPSWINGNLLIRLRKAQGKEEQGKRKGENGGRQERERPLSQ